MSTPPTHFPVPGTPVGDRRSPERRSAERRLQERAELLRTAAGAAIAICGGVAALFFAFAALGAINAGNAIAATVVACALGAVWVGGLVHRTRHADRRINRRDRERRGF